MQLKNLPCTVNMSTKENIVINIPQSNVTVYIDMLSRNPQFSTAMITSSEIIVVVAFPTL